MGAERTLTERLQRFFPAPRDAAVAIGDDAAVVRNRGGDSVLCVDPVIEGVHYERGTDLLLVGRKAVNRNLADLAAMGAVPDYLLVSLVLGKRVSAADLDRLLRGIRAAARVSNCFVVGGDVAAFSGPMVVTVTAVGHLEGRALRRSGAKVGDAIHVTGPLGGSLDGRHLTFRPPLAEGLWLARANVPATAAMDISDGLLLDLWTMLRASGGLGAELEARAVPITAAARRRSGAEPARALKAALGDGEDHELLFTVASGKELPRGGPLSRRARRPIGRVIREPGLWLLDRGERRLLRPLGHEHAIARS
ncbi:MAG: thiamine-phosphate kinase [Planctomycetota bacterium]